MIERAQELHCVILADQQSSIVLTESGQNAHEQCFDAGNVIVGGAQ